MYDDDVPPNVIRATPPQMERPRPSNTTSLDIPHHLRKKLINRQESDPPMFNLGGNETQALVNLAKASRTTGQVVAGIKVIQEAFNTEVTQQQITYAMRKAGITPISNPDDSWSATDTNRLLQ